MKAAVAVGLCLVVAGCSDSDPEKQAANTTKTAKTATKGGGYHTPTGKPNQGHVGNKGAGNKGAGNKGAGNKGDWAKGAKLATKKNYKKVDPKTIAITPGPAATGNVGFRASYMASKNTTHDAIRVAFQNDKVWESLASVLNALIKVPKTIDIVMADCGQPNAFYDPQRSRIIMCYELVVYLATVFKPGAKSEEELGLKSVAATIFVFFHEVGHALRDVLQLPVTGPEEDAVDELATLLLLDLKQGLTVAAYGAEAFQLIHKDKKLHGKTLPFWNEHSLGEQRYYNVVCLIYGSNPKAYQQQLVGQGYLPKRRAQRCHGDYQKKSKAWQTILKPHFTPAVLKSIAAHNKPGGAAAAGDCKKAVVHIFRLARKLLQQKSPQQIPAFDKKVPAATPKMLNLCRTKWTPAQRACVFRAINTQQATACFP